MAEEFHTRHNHHITLKALCQAIQKEKLPCGETQELSKWLELSDRNYYITLKVLRQVLMIKPTVHPFAEGETMGLIGKEVQLKRNLGHSHYNILNKICQ